MAIGYCIVIASFLFGVCTKHIVEGLKREYKKKELKEKCMTAVVATSTRKESLVKLKDVMRKDHKDNLKDTRMRFSRFLDYIYDSLLRFINHMTNKKRTVHSLINPSKYLEFCNVRKGNGPNVK